MRHLPRQPVWRLVDKKPVWADIFRDLHDSKGAYTPLTAASGESYRSFLFEVKTMKREMFQLSVEALEDGSDTIVINQEDPSETDGHSIYIKASQIEKLVQWLLEISVEIEK